MPAFIATDRNRRISDERFEYRRCQACGTLGLAAVPDDIGRYYPHEYYALPSSREELMVSAASERYKLDLIRTFAPGGRLIEVGPAIGGFAVHAQGAGYDTSAIEMDADCCRFLREVVGIEVYETADPSTALRNNGRFDVIAMWQVLEHLADPVSVLEAAASALAPGGILVIAVPNPEALQFRVFGVRWAHIDAPRHRSLIPARALAALAERLGLEVAMVATRDTGTVGWNWFGWRESLAGYARDERARRLLRFAGSVVTRLVAPVERRRENAATYTLVLRRPGPSSAAPPRSWAGTLRRAVRLVRGLPGVAPMLPGNRRRAEVLQHPAGRRPDAIAGLMPDRSPDDRDVEIAGRLLRAYDAGYASAQADPGRSRQDIWTMISARQATFAAVMADGDPEGLAAYLCNVSRHDASDWHRPG